MSAESRTLADNAEADLSRRVRLSRPLAVVAIGLLCSLMASGVAWAALLPQPKHGVGQVRTIALPTYVQAKCIVGTPDGDMWVLNGNAPTSLWEIRASKVIGHFTLPLGYFTVAATSCMVLGPDQNLWFIDPAATTVSHPAARAVVAQFSLQTHKTTIFPLPDATANPTAMSAGPNGVWFTETSPNESLGFIDPSGQIKQIPLPGATSLNDILAASNGNVWFDAGYKSGEDLVEETPNGSVLRRIAEPDGGDQALIARPDGQIWISDGSGVFALTGSTFKLLWQTADNPQSMTTGPGGSLWFVSAWFGCLQTQYGILSSDLEVHQYTSAGCANSIAQGPPGLVYYTANGFDVYEVAATKAGFNVALPSVATKSVVAPITELPTPGNAFSGGVRTVVNVTITVAALVALTFPAQLFNNTFEENYEEITILTKRRTRNLDKFRKRLSSQQRKHDDEARFVLVVLVGSLLAALRSPTFGFNGGSVEQFVATVLAVVISIAVTFAVARWYRTRNHLSVDAKLRALPAGLLVTILCVLMSRVADFQPGYLYGVIAGVVFSSELKKRQEGQLVAVTAIGVLLVSILAWLLWVPVDHSAMHHGASFIVVIADEILATVFVGGITGLVVSLLPLRFMPGYHLYNWHRGAWAATFGVCAFLLVEVLLRPAASTSHSGHVAWVTAAVLFVIFGVGSVLFREFFDRHVPEDKQRLGLAGRVIQTLWETDGQTSKQIAHKLGVSADHVDAVVTRLERAHWVKSTEPEKGEPSDLLLHLTQSGKATEKGFAVLSWLTRRRLNFGLTAADRKLLHEHLEASYPAVIK